MSEKFSFAEAVEVMAAGLINDHHQYLAEARIKYLFRAGKWEKGDKTVLGKTKLASEDTRFIADYDFVIMINEEAWSKATHRQKMALLDHELTHCDYSEDAEGNRKWRVADHDVQEFVSIVGRHGLWETDLQKLMVAARNAPYVDGLHNQIDMFVDHDEKRDDEASAAVN